MLAFRYLYKSSCKIAASDVGRWFVIGTGVVVVDNFANGIVIDAKYGICIIFTWLNSVKNYALIYFPHLCCCRNARTQFSIYFRDVIITWLKMIFIYLFQKILIAYSNSSPSPREGKGWVFYMQLCTPRLVAIAVSIAASVCKINFHVSFFIITSFFVYQEFFIFSFIKN